LPLPVTIRTTALLQSGTMRGPTCTIAEAVRGPGFFRLLLASTVMVSHFTRLSLGVFAVYVFFVLSGYWITVMWKRKYSRSKVPFTAFVVSRFWRLLPAFLLINLICILTAKALGFPVVMTPRALFSNLFLLGYASLKTGVYDPPAWSLDIEMQFYLVVPLFFLAMRRAKEALWLGLVVLSLLGLHNLWTHPNQGTLTMLPYTPFFAIGVAVAWFDIRVPRRVAIGSASLWIVTCAAILVLPGLRGMLLVGRHPDAMAIYNDSLLIILAFFVAPLALWTVRQKSSPTDKMAGDLSYLVYLVHYLLMLLLRKYAEGVSHIQMLPWLVGGVPGIFIMSFLIWKYYDHPINRWRERTIALAAFPAKTTASAA
jgi:peptidoglycan/LPS O-acetylase OafA/YrhL